MDKAFFMPADNASQVLALQPDFSANQVMVRDVKGFKDRLTMLPTAVNDQLQGHLENVRHLHASDLSEGWGRVRMPYSLAKKYPNAATECRWQWMFPQAHRWQNRSTGEQGRHHVDESAVMRSAIPSSDCVLNQGPTIRRRLMSRKALRGTLAAVLVAIFVALCITASVSHGRAFEALLKTDDAIAVALLEVHPEIAAVLADEFRRDVEGNASYAAFINDNGETNINLTQPHLRYTDAGNSREVGRGGLLDGPTIINRDVVLYVTDPETDFSVLPITGHIDKVKIRIECYIPWRFFPGKQVVKVKDLGAPNNTQFIELLVSALETKGITCIVGS